MSGADTDLRRGVRWAGECFLTAHVIAWVRADYLQFRREEVRRQRPTGIARGEEHGGCRESGAAFSMVAQVRGLLKGGLVEGLLPRGGLNVRGLWPAGQPLTWLNPMTPSHSEE